MSGNKNMLCEYCIKKYRVCLLNDAIWVRFGLFYDKSEQFKWHAIFFLGIYISSKSSLEMDALFIFLSMSICF